MYIFAFLTFNEPPRFYLSKRYFSKGAGHPEYYSIQLDSAEVMHNSFRENKKKKTWTKIKHHITTFFTSHRSTVLSAHNGAMSACSESNTKREDIYFFTTLTQ